jgi:hypothetical protein
MSKMKVMALALALGSSVSFAGSAALACGAVDVDSAGYRQRAEVNDFGDCNNTKVFQRGRYNGARVDTDGWRNTTRVTQTGRNQSANVRVRGDLNQTHVFTGICPPGSASRNVDVVGDGRLDVFVPDCR